MAVSRWMLELTELRDVSTPVTAKVCGDGYNGSIERSECQRSLASTPDESRLTTRTASFFNAATYEIPSRTKNPNRGFRSSRSSVRG